MKKFSELSASEQQKVKSAQITATKFNALTEGEQTEILAAKVTPKGDIFENASEVHSYLRNCEIVGFMPSRNPQVKMLHFRKGDETRQLPVYHEGIEGFSRIQLLGRFSATLVIADTVQEGAKASSYIRNIVPDLEKLTDRQVAIYSGNPIILK